MNRHAIIVSAPGGGQMSVLAGVSKDVNLYNRFLLSPHGGGWTTSEITILNDPPRSHLLGVLAAVRADYAVTIFSGHGGHRDPHSDLCINQSETVTSDEFQTNALRQLTICDTCRAVEAKVELREDRVKVGAGIGAPPDLYWMSCREAYERAIEATPVFREIMWACSIGETAADTNDGGLFSRGLVVNALRWAEEAKRASYYETTRRALNVPTAFAGAKSAVEAALRTQHPDLQTHRGMHWLPFAVG